MADFILGRLKFKWKGDWVTSTTYIKDDIVKYGANTYVCINNHTSNDFYTDLGNTNWSLFTESFSYNTTNTAWQQSTAYKINDVVRWGANLYICNTQHTSSTAWSTNSAKFTLFLPGLEFEDSWNSGTSYQTGDIVTYGGYTYVAQLDNQNKIPSSNTSEWKVVTTGFNVRGDYSNSTAYKVGDVIRHGGYTYVCKTDNDGTANPTTTTGNTTSTNTTYWDLLNTGQKYKGNWATGNLYLLGDIVTVGSSSFIAIQEHTSASNLAPATTATHWDTLSEGDSTNVMTTEGDLLTRTSSANSRLPIGPEGWQLTSMNGTNTSNFHAKEIGWKSGGQAKTWYVDTQRGQDKKNLLYSPGTSGQTNFLDYDAATTYYPGDVVKWSPPTWSASTTYDKGDLVFYEDTHTTGRRYWFVSKTSSNLNNAPSSTFVVDSTNWALFAPGTPVQTGLTGNQNYGASPLFGVDTAGNKLYKVYQLVSSSSLGTSAIAPYDQGSNNQGSTANWHWEEVSHGLQLDNNNQHVTGVVSWGKGPEAPFKSIRYALSLAKTGDQIICAPGVYKETLPMVIPAGVGIMGYEMRTTFIEPDMENDNGYGVGKSTDGSTPNNEVAMFLCNDSVTVRGFTFRGLTGTVLGTQVGGHTEPTVKGVCFALDPNGGIYQKSPFIQNCCAINPGGGGIFCDGSVGTGRYHSFTTNDFTQINSDGFGLFATNKGRIEAVSVFTYYCHVGYTTTHGGIIRSANGNNSYGYYGSVSEGYDANESPKTAVVDNKTEEAKVYRVVVNTAGANAGKVQWLEWQYAGEAYTGSPTVTLTAPGDPDAAGAAFSLSTQVGGIARIKMSAGSQQSSTLTKALGNAQAGRATGTTANNSATQAEITLAVTDSVANDGYNGMMLFITSGTGAGQYGLIHDYIGATKIAEIKNADNTGGWTSINGETIVAPDTTSVYEIGPAVTITNQGAGAGTGALCRCIVTTTNEIEEILILDPGSGYSSATADKPKAVIVDPRANTGGAAGDLSNILFDVTVTNGVLKSTRSNAGSGYPTGVSQGVSQSGQTYATVVDDSGSPTGYAEIPQTGSYIKVKNLTGEPKAGSQLKFTGSNPTNTTWYQIVNVIGYLNAAATIHISPKMTTSLSPADGEALEIREEYSSCRMTGHDFLDVGTKTYITSNYPGTPTQAADQTKEVLEVCGGRVFYTSTDQDGNFRVGNLFTVQQSTGKATLNAEDFDLAGLQELKFGSLQFGGQSAIVTEFSTDGTMSGNSDTALPTEKAVRTYVTSQLGGGENDLTVNTAIVGTVNLSGNSLTTTTGSNNDLVINSDSGKASFTAEPQYAGSITTDHTLITKSYYEDQFNATDSLENLLETYSANENAVDSQRSGGGFN